MRRILLSLLLLCISSIPVSAINLEQGGYDKGPVNADQITVKTDNFYQNLSYSDTNVQKALETLDALVASGGGSSSINWNQIGGLQSDINLSGFTNDVPYISNSTINWSNLPSVQSWQINWTGITEATITDINWSNYVTEAPQNGSQYARQNGGWSVVNAMVYPGAGLAKSTGSAWDTSVTDNSGNWNTAYGWGNHASAGYLTAVTSDSPLSGAGTSADHLKFTNPGYITGNQTITLTGDVIGSGTTSINDSINWTSVGDYNSGFMKWNSPSAPTQDTNTYLTSYTETDPKVGTLSNNKVSKWGTTTLVDSTIYDNGTSVSIGTTTPLDTFTIQTNSGGETINYIPTGIGGIDAYTKLLLHMDGSNGGTTFTDSETVPKTVNTNGTITTSTSQYKYGTTSGYFNGAGNLYIAQSTDFDTSSNSMAIDMWVYPTSLPTSGNQIALCGKYQASNNRWDLTIYNDTGTQKFYITSQNPNWSVSAAATGITTNSWQHIAVTRSSGVYRFFINGTQVGGDQAQASAIASPSGNFEVGSRSGGTIPFTGYIDEFRFTNNTSRWTTNFTPPTGPYDALSTTPNPNIVLEGSTVQTAKIWTDGNDTNKFKIDVPTTTRMTIDTAGLTTFSNGITSTAAANAMKSITLSAGTNTAGTAPIYLTSGTSLTNAVAGATEFTTDDLFFTITTGTARKRLLMADPVGGLTSTRVPYATTNGRLTDASGFTFDGTILTVANIKDSGLTSGRMPYATTSGQLTDTANLTWDNTNSAITMASGTLQSAVTHGLVVNSGMLNTLNDVFNVKGSVDGNLIITDVVNDRVGIGTATPATKLEVDGTIYPKGGTYWASDGTAGVTASGATSCTITAIKDGIITAATCI